MNSKLGKKFDALPPFIYDYYERKVLVDEILSIHRGFDKKELIEWVAIVLLDGTREYWRKRAFSPYWNVSSLRLSKYRAPVQPKVLRESCLTKSPSKKRCRLCGAQLEKATFIRQFYEDGEEKFAICAMHSTNKLIEDKLWLTKQAPRSKGPLRVTRKQFIAAVVKAKKSEALLRRQK